jgi:predicted PurR-regulated permease PerM
VHTVRVELPLRSVLSVVAVGAALWLLVRLWQVLLVLLVAGVLAGTLNPLLDWLEARRLPRPLALGVILLVLLLPLVGLGALVVPQLAGQASETAAAAPALQERLAATLAGVPALAPLAAAVRGATVDQAIGPLAAGALPLAGQAAGAAGLALVAVVLAFYLLADRERVLGYLYAQLPRRYHVRTARVLLDMETAVGGCVRGQALTSVLIAAYVFTVLSLAGTPNALALAVVAALADLVPFVGGVLVLAPTVLATLGVGPGPALAVGTAILLYLWFVSQVLVPHVYGRTLRLSPVAVTVALLAGGTLLGIVGALLALPLAAGVRVLIEDLRIELPGEQSGEAAERAREPGRPALRPNTPRGRRGRRRSTRRPWRARWPRDSRRQTWLRAGGRRSRSRSAAAPLDRAPSRQARSRSAPFGSLLRRGPAPGARRAGSTSIRRCLPAYERSLSTSCWASCSASWSASRTEACPARTFVTMAFMMGRMPSPPGMLATNRPPAMPSMVSFRKGSLRVKSALLATDWCTGTRRWKVCHLRSFSGA